MQRFTIMGLTMLATFAIVCVGAVSVSASGSEFVANKIGKVKDKETNMQIFKTSSGTVECSEVVGSGEITEKNSVTNKEVMSYKGCTGGGNNVTIGNADFEFNANGSAKLENEVVAKVEGSSGCEIVIEPQTLSKVAYANSSGTIVATAKVKGIHSKGSGGMCGGIGTEGSYTGSIAAELEGGTVEWK